MTASRRPVRRSRPARPGEEPAVSSVLGAILLFGLLVVTLVIVQVKFVPVWDEDREARHMQVVSNQMAALLSDLGRVAANESSASLTDPLTLAADPGGFRFFRAPAGSSGSGAAFAPSSASTGLNVSASNLRLLQRNGDDLFGLGESWLSIPATSTTVQNILRVDHLRIRVDMIPGDYDDGDSATLTITDASGAFAGKAVVIFREFPSENALETKVYNRLNQEISSDVEAFFQQTSVDYFYINLMDPSLLFRTVLGATQNPFHLSLIRDGLGADYALAATTVGGVSGGGGLLVPSYGLDAPSGTLSLTARNNRFPSQTFVVEHGALIVTQPEGSVMRVPPAFQVAATSQSATLAWTVPGLVGDVASISGGNSASVIATPTGERNDILGVAAAVSVRIPTAYPAIWQQFLEDRMRGAGLSSLAGQYTLTPGATNVTLTLNGPSSASGVEDVVLSLQQSTIRLDVRPTG